MPTVFFSPIGNGYQFLNQTCTAPLNSGKLYTYAANTTTPEDTYTSMAGDTKNSNPITIDIYGRAPQEIWLTQGVLYDLVLYDSLGNLIRTYEDIPGVNDTTFSNFSILLQDEGVDQGSVTTLNIVGADVTAAVAGSIGTITTSVPTPVKYQMLGFELYDANTSLAVETPARQPALLKEFNVSNVYAQVDTVSSSGTPTFDIRDDGVSILSTLITIDANEKTSLTAATPPVISSATIAAGSLLTFPVSITGTGTKGAYVYMWGYWT